MVLGVASTSDLMKYQLHVVISERNMKHSFEVDCKLMVLQIERIDTYHSFALLTGVGYRKTDGRH